MRKPSSVKGAVLAVVGAQWGSEGKGVIVHHIANRFGVHVRTGGPNAGHTFVHKGKQWMFQSVPCGWTNPEAIVVIGRGALVDVETLVKEISNIYEYDPTIIHRLFIDREAGVISPWHSAMEGGVNGEIHQRIGSTGKGVGAARVARVNRDPVLFKRIMDIMGDFGNQQQGWELSDMVYKDTTNTVMNLVDKGQNVLLEGAQGSGLSLLHGPWPYVTSEDTNAATLAASAGIPPQYVQTLLIARTFPIRVAGNSGPMVGETSWDEISRLTGRITEEKTTVTKKIRRVGKWDDALMARSVRLNAADQVAITFMDYLEPSCVGATTVEQLGNTSRRFVEYVSHRFEVSVPFVGTGGDGFNVVETGALVLHPYLQPSITLNKFE